MDESKIARYRAQAEACLINAERTPDMPTKRYWIELAAAWTRIADDFAKAGVSRTSN
jgi:hypothetical protein